MSEMKYTKNMEIRIAKAVAFDEIMDSVIEDLGMDTLEEWDKKSLSTKRNYKLDVVKIVDNVVWFLKQKKRIEAEYKELNKQ